MPRIFYFLSIISVFFQAGQIVAAPSKTDGRRAEVKLTIAETQSPSEDDFNSTLEKLGYFAALRAGQVDYITTTFWDTSDAELYNKGVYLRTRDFHSTASVAISPIIRSEVTLKLRGVDMGDISNKMRSMPGAKIETDYSSSGVLSYSVSTKTSAGEVQSSILKNLAAVSSSAPVFRLTSAGQKLFFRKAGRDFQLSRLEPLKSAQVVWWRIVGARKITFEIWNLPDGSRLIEASTVGTIDQVPQIQDMLREYIKARNLSESSQQIAKTSRLFKSASSIASSCKIMFGQ